MANETKTITAGGIRSVLVSGLDSNEKLQMQVDVRNAGSVGLTEDEALEALGIAKEDPDKKRKALEAVPDQAKREQLRSKAVSKLGFK